jgi:hypothetical protein
VEFESSVEWEGAELKERVDGVDDAEGVVDGAMDGVGVE